MSSSGPKLVPDSVARLVTIREPPWGRVAIMSTVPRARPLTTLRVGILAFAAINLLLALGLAFAPHAFFSDVGPYGAQNDHYMRDLSTFYAALGAALLI